MDKLKSAHSKLDQAARLLDEAASELVGSEISCQAADVQSVGEALAIIMDIKLSIYEKRPELKPEYLDEQRPNPDANREFGRILLQSERLLSENRPTEAIALFEAFVKANPPQEFIEMANGQIDSIKEMFAI